MKDYCINPPLIGVPTKPNLLFMLDNSSSMFDLTYVDEGKPGTCSEDATKTCYKNADCTGICNGSPREPNYCYDQTYKSTNDYVGYFDKDTFYKYDATYGDLFEIAVFPADADCASTLKKISSPVNTLYVCYTTSPRNVTLFAATGNYLNWLTASKFDEQKEILTGGKYVTKVCSNDVDKSCILNVDCPSGGTCVVVTNAFLQGESRGCVGRGFVKEALTADFVNYADTSINPNTSLGITFSIKGPVDETNATAPSSGGQTSIAVLLGDYNESLCQAAIDALDGGTLGTIKSTLDDCLSATTEAGAYCKLDTSLSCTKDTDCSFGSGSCSIINDGACNVSTGGTCGVKTAGVCTAYNSPTCSCTGSKCTKICGNAGPNNGKTCNNVGQCTTSGCTAGNPALINTVCSTNANCDEKWCTAGRVGDSCSSDANCNPSACNGGPRAGLICTINAQCNSSNCVAPSHASKIGSLCSINADCNSNLGPCISGTATTVSKTKVVFNQSMQACWAYDGGAGTDIGNDEVNTVHNQCEDLYDENYICLGGDNDGLICTSDADCPGGGNCENGPVAIQPGNAAYLCSRNYTGFCATTTDNWVHTTWIANGYASADECIKQKHRDFCDIMDAPEVIDPTDDPSVTETYDNLPAIISDIGVEAQLGQPLKNIKVRVRMSTPPTHLIHQFKDLIRMGAMTFNYNGSISECASAPDVPCPKVCSTDTSKVCGSNFDCPSPATATCTVTANNFDGSKVVHYIGNGNCSITTATECTTSANCPEIIPGIREKCMSDGVGDHTTGLIRIIDDIRGSTWTPFSEAYYNAIGYMATDRRCDNSASTRCTKASDCPSGGTCPVSTGLSRTDMRINAADFVVNRNPSDYMCQKNNILLITDGMSTADQRSAVSSLASLYAPAVVRSPGPAGEVTTSSATGCEFAGSKNLDDLAWIARNRNINTFSTLAVSPTNTAPRSSDYITTHVVFAGAESGGSDDCSSEILLGKTATSGGTILKTAQNPEELDEELEKALWEIAAGAVSGTAASVLASGEGSGANLIQAVFYPTKKFFNSATGTYDEITWTGRLTNLWFYVDPFFSQSSIREDDGDKVLNLFTELSTTGTGTGSKDFITTMYFDSTTETVKAKRFTDTNGDGSPDSQLADISIENIPNLWEAGTLLWKRDLATDPRTIYTSTTGTSLIAFSTANAATLRSFLTATTNAQASNIISYVTGSDVSGYRPRTVKVDLTGDGDTNDTGETTARVWKLGDILNSTPKISSWLPLNTFNKVYGDGTYGIPYTDSGLGDAVNPNRYTTTTSYKARGMVFVGGNDGMLHAFKLGKLELKWSGQQTTQVARLTGSDLGKEMWAFIPNNSLPYLKYMADTGYCHLYSVDLTPYIFDASIGSGAGDESATTRSVSSWRTILIGGMRYGGACRNSTTTCTDVDGDGAKDCVNTPVPGLGYSSYFALDITDQDNPALLWEYVNEELGYTTTGPVVVRLKARDASGNELPNANGKWFVVLASGPTGPISTIDRQFMGRSDQNLKLFVLDLKSGTLEQTIDTGIANAFAGNMLGTSLDADLDYQDDVIYIPYIKKGSASQTWTDGGVGRLFTKEDPINTNTWTFSKVTADNIGPVTATVGKLVDSTAGAVWLYFGTGRYFFEKSGSADDGSSQRHIIGLKDPCYSSSGFDTSDSASCLSPNLALGDLTNVTTTLITTPPANGWYIALDSAGAYGPYVNPTDPLRAYNAERNITDPSASTRGLTYFTTYKPYDDDCSLTGRTYLWCTKYDTGGACGDLLVGTIVIQLSTGQIKQVDLATAFTEMDERKADIGIGAPPGPGGGTIAPRSAINKTVHIKER